MSLLIDIRTPYQLSLVNAILSSDILKQHRDIFYVVPDHLYCKLSEQQRKSTFTYRKSPSKYSNIIYYVKMSLKIRKHIDDNEINLLTALNHGPLFLSLQMIMRAKVFLYEDGISTYLKLRHKLSIRKKYKFLLSKNYQAAYLNNNIRSHLNPKLLPRVQFYNHSRSLEKKELKLSVFVSSSSIEYGLDTEEAFRERLQEIRSITGDDQLLVSFHHNEHQWSEKIKYIEELYSQIIIVEHSSSLEDCLQKYDIDYFIAPYNTTALNIFREFDCNKFVLYDDKGPNMRERKKLFKELEIQQEVIQI